MHKDDAAKLFAVLGDATAVKCLKIAYNNEFVLVNQLVVSNGNDMAACKNALTNLENVNLIKIDNEKVYANKGLVDELMGFIARPCGCTKVN